MSAAGASPDSRESSGSRTRLLLVAYEYPPLGGGLGKAVRETGLQLARRDFEVTILTSRFGDLPAYESDGALNIVRIPVMRRHAHHATVFDVLSFSVSGVLFGHGRLDGFVPDFVLSYLTIPSGIAGLWLARRVGVPHLTLLRGTDVPGHRELAPWMHRLAAPLIRYIWRQSLRVVSNSEATARQAEAAVPDVSVATVYNGVVLDRFRPDDSLVSKAPLKVLYSGRLVKVKRLDLLLRVWAEVIPFLREPAVLEIAGYGPERESLEAQVEALGLRDRVIFLGQLNEEEMIRAYQQASVFVSLSADEGLPNAVLEAMASGLPVVLSDIGPHREILGDASAGELCDTARPEAVREAILELLQEPEKRELAVRNARAAIEGRFDWGRTAEGLIALLEDPI